MRTINGIIVHCTATRPDWWDGKPTRAKVTEIKRWHVQDRGWKDIGYHYLIDRDGTVAVGRPLDQVGAHVQGHNTGTIGISLFGGHGSAETDNFEENFTFEQDVALRQLIAKLRLQFGPLPVTGHNEYAAKACPGFNVRNWLRKPVALQPPKQAPKPADLTPPVSSPEALRPAPPKSPVIPIFAVLAAIAAALWAWLTKG